MTRPYDSLLAVLLAVLLAGALSAEAAQGKSAVPAASSLVVAPDSTAPLYVVRHGWHAGLLVRRAEAVAFGWPALEDFPDVSYLEAGWGEAGYFPDRAPGMGDALRAGLWPTDSVVHLTGFRSPPMRVFGAERVVRIDLPSDALAAVVQHIREAVRVTDDGRAERLQDGWYGVHSGFYASDHRYHAFQNCNTWAAEALRAAGCDTNPAWALRVQNVMAAARACRTAMQTP
jgi:uncharacterized protein (TIGR02117 family)